MFRNLGVMLRGLWKREGGSSARVEELGRRNGSVVAQAMPLESRLKECSKSRDKGTARVRVCDDLAGCESRS